MSASRLARFRRSHKGYCHVVDTDCKAPAGIGVGGWGYAGCRRGDVWWCAGGCGEEVCEACSTPTRTHGARWCRSCTEEHGGTGG